MKKIFLCLFAVAGLLSCDDLFEPSRENVIIYDEMYEKPDLAYGMLMPAYMQLPYDINTDLATDNAVSNDTWNSYRNITGGQWSALKNPFDGWTNRINSILTTNLFLENVEKVRWTTNGDPTLQRLFVDRMSGEAYALRALHMMYLIRNHAGYTDDGELMGVPIILHSMNANSDFNIARSSFGDCVDQVMKDFDKAIELLPLDYETHTDVPQIYVDELGLEDVGIYNRVNGEGFKGLLSGRMAEAMRSQMALLAASPAFAVGSDLTWEDAAELAGDVLDRIGGVNGLSANGLNWYCQKTEIDNLSTGDNPQEILWRSTISETNQVEADNFPPTLYGYGRTNPTENLVQAFPMVNGYPITDARSKYDAANPYANRDPRLKEYIVYDGGAQGSAIIYTGRNSSTTDGIDKENNRSTRTGYYMRKHTRSYANPNSANPVKAKSYSVRLRYTEMFLNYAEAANEAYGPTGSPAHLTFSAYDVISAIRKRAGISQPDKYLAECTTKAKMRELIRNERRLELCFEGFRFWDIRRWSEQGAPLDQMSETAMGYDVSASIDREFEVEKRDFKEHMIYAPIPNSEILKYNKLQQNQGW